MAEPGAAHKTSAVRVLACDVALDPVADLWVHELAGKGDLEPLGQVCHRYCSGLDDESIAYAAESVRLLRAELGRRQARFKKLPKEAKPDGKLTRELAADRRLRPIVAIFDEYQNLHMHPEFGKQASEDLAYVIRLGRAYGIIVIISTQRPASECVPTSITGIVTARFCLKVPDQPANDMVLGTSSYRAGYDATAFRAKTDAGLGWLKGEGDPQAVRTYYLDLPATARIAARARAMRETAGVLSGYRARRGRRAAGAEFRRRRARRVRRRREAVVRDGRRPAPRAAARRLRRHHPGGCRQPAPRRSGWTSRMSANRGRGRGKGASGRRSRPLRGFGSWPVCSATPAESVAAPRTAA